MLPKTVTISDAGVVTPYDNSDTRAARELKEGGELWRLAKPIKHKDEDGRVYDFLERFVEEYTFFPFAPHDDILDACSRIHDMQVVGPVFYDHEPGRANSVEPEIFVDGI